MIQQPSLYEAYDETEKITWMYCDRTGIPRNSQEAKKHVYYEIERILKIITWGNDQPEAVLRAIMASKLNHQILMEIFEELGYIE